MKQYFAETLQVISFKNNVSFLLARTELEKMYPHLKKSHFFYNINHNTEPLSINVFFLFEDVTGCC